jgi:hypothetical protein
LVTNWTSSNPGVLAVSSSGWITAIDEGTATVSATVNGVTQSSGVITVSRATIGIAHSGSSLVLNWPAGALLLQAPTLLGPWTTNTAAVSPYTVPLSGGNQFFRLQSSH